MMITYKQEKSTWHQIFSNRVLRSDIPCQCELGIIEKETVTIDIDSGRCFSGWRCQVCGFPVQLDYFYTVETGYFFRLWVKVEPLKERKTTEKSAIVLFQIWQP